MGETRDEMNLGNKPSHPLRPLFSTAASRFSDCLKEYGLYPSDTSTSCSSTHTPYRSFPSLPTRLAAHPSIRGGREGELLKLNTQTKEANTTGGNKRKGNSQGALRGLSSHLP
ncbi:hypothetical protein E2C01_090503 [Portunus trituberculatus]|uniref:Uncharacterized protein n=1 Tax=Portunus trituberculatus TaxID=210409 RepID=A0A5B7JKD5_PORTR|nr:hypothetical protein [Portunus trituberculatus]